MDLVPSRIRQTGTHNLYTLSFSRDIFTDVIKDEVEHIRAATAQLCEPLHDAFAWAVQRQRTQVPEMSGAAYGWMRTHMARAHAHHRLGSPSVTLGDWRLSGNHRRNGELWLTNNEYRTRLLHGFRDDHVPAPGPNRQRRAFYQNRPLQKFGQPTLMGPEDNDLLILWRVDAEGAPLFRVVRTIGTWRFGKEQLVDLDFPLLASAADLHDLHFEPQDEGLELELPEEETNDADGAGGFSW
ncbi:hypothetical protein ACFXCU_11230 [Streptomyces virginiae]|uniref:hypothetical protein n=1 Tax=Streptomyces virginiae TaxID=1961 RepID=UPI00367F66E7